MEKENLPLPLFVRVLADNSKDMREAFKIRKSKKKMMVMMIISAMIIIYTAYLCSTYNGIDIIIGRPSFASVIPYKETAI